MSTNAVVRQFEAKPAVREAVGLLISLVGPSSSGKTFSALRVAGGIQQVVGGDIDVIDTENGRALYYADRFKFNHVRFAAPFSPLDYLAAIEYSAKRGARTIVIDSFSHEHEGQGGVLEMHEEEVQRLSGGDPAKAERVKILAWARPKAQRRKLIRTLLQLNVNLVMTFRAKEKLKIITGKPPVDIGWQPIAGEDYIYEMVLQCLLKPGANGIPTLQSPNESERAMIKIPEQFKDMFAGNARQLDEDLGVKLAEWARGDEKPDPRVESLLQDYAKKPDAGAFKALEERRRIVWPDISRSAQARLKAASVAATSAPASGAPVIIAGTDSPQPISEDIARDLIRLSASPTEVQAEFTKIVANFEATGREMPDDLHPMYMDRLATLEQEAAQL